MSIEEIKNDLTPEQEAGYALINGNPLLKEDYYAKKVVAANGVVESGIKVNIGDFLVIRANALEEAIAKAKLAAAKERNPAAYDAAVINSVRPDLEKYIEE